MTGIAIGMPYSIGQSVPATAGVARAHTTPQGRSRKINALIKYSLSNRPVFLFIQLVSLEIHPEPYPLCLGLPLELPLAFLAGPDYSTGCTITLEKFLE